MTALVNKLKTPSRSFVVKLLVAVVAVLLLVFLWIKSVFYAEPGYIN